MRTAMDEDHEWYIL